MSDESDGSQRSFLDLLTRWERLGFAARPYNEDSLRAHSRKRRPGALLTLRELAALRRQRGTSWEDNLYVIAWTRESSDELLPYLALERPSVPERASLTGAYGGHKPGLVFLNAANRHVAFAGLGRRAGLFIYTGDGDSDPDSPYATSLLADDPAEICSRLLEDLEEYGEACASRANASPEADIDDLKELLRRGRPMDDGMFYVDDDPDGMGYSRAELTEMVEEAEAAERRMKASLAGLCWLLPERRAHWESLDPGDY